MKVHEVKILLFSLMGLLALGVPACHRKASGNMKLGDSVGSVNAIDKKLGTSRFFSREGMVCEVPVEKPFALCSDCIVACTGAAQDKRAFPHSASSDFFPEELAKHGLFLTVGPEAILVGDVEALNLDGGAADTATIRGMMGSRLEDEILRVLEVRQKHDSLSGENEASIAFVSLADTVPSRTLLQLIYVLGQSGISEILFPAPGGSRVELALDCSRGDANQHPFHYEESDPSAGKPLPPEEFRYIWYCRRDSHSDRSQGVTFHGSELTRLLLPSTEAAMETKLIAKVSTTSVDLTLLHHASVDGEGFGRLSGLESTKSPQISASSTTIASLPGCEQASTVCVTGGTGTDPHGLVSSFDYEALAAIAAPHLMREDLTVLVLPSDDVPAGFAVRVIDALQHDNYRDPPRYQNRKVYVGVSGD